MDSKLKRLCKRLDYEFENLIFLKQALTHCSVGNINNERLEFLGDSILSFVIANALYDKFPEKSEGELSRLRAYLVKGDMLAEIAKGIELGDSLYLGQGELKSGGFRRASILADTLEAIFAAIFLDSNLAKSQRVILHLYHSRLEDQNLNSNLKDAKTQLQEHLQAQKKPLPQYKLIKVEGEEHQQIFYVSCELPELGIKCIGEGANRRKAEQLAAQDILQRLGSTVDR